MVELGPPPLHKLDSDSKESNPFRNLMSYSNVPIALKIPLNFQSVLKTKCSNKSTIFAFEFNKIRKSFLENTE